MIKREAFVALLLLLLELGGIVVVWVALKPRVAQQKLARTLFAWAIGGLMLLTIVVLVLMVVIMNQKVMYE